MQHWYPRPYIQTQQVEFYYVICEQFHIFVSSDYYLCNDSWEIRVLLVSPWGFHYIGILFALGAMVDSPHKGPVKWSFDVTRTILKLSSASEITPNNMSQIDHHRKTNKTKWSNLKGYGLIGSLPNHNKEQQIPNHNSWHFLYGQWWFTIANL